ncbi:hypothetical protein ACQPXB_28115 [Amycolatopsis sp. CA-161197]|uniref:hypothetical protein n=1 Tax=Amycolatopsis sp. CA-161197 TaxID=3239922 RepID=UPI003D8CA392
MTGFTDHSGCRDRWTISVTAGLVTVTGASRTRPSDGSWPRSHGPVHGVVDVDFRTRGAGT